MKNRVIQTLKDSQDNIVYSQTETIETSNGGPGAPGITINSSNDIPLWAIVIFLVLLLKK